MQAIHLLPESERKFALRQAILRRAPGIPPDQISCICESVNTNRPYFIKPTTNKQKFLNLATRETIITENTRTFSEILPLYGNFKPPYFERVGERRLSKEGTMDPTLPAAAVKIRAGTEHQRSSATYTLIIYLAEQTTMQHGLN